MWSPVHIAYQIVFLATGLFQTLSIQWLYYHGAADGFSLLTVSTTFFGMLCISCLSTLRNKLLGDSSDSRLLISLPNRSKDYDLMEKSERRDKKVPQALMKKNPPSTFAIACTALIDFLGCVFCTFGLFFVGSGSYQIIYSSVILFTALFSRLFLKRHLTLVQWGALLLIFFGLSISSIAPSKVLIHARSLAPQSNQSTPDHLFPGLEAIHHLPPSVSTPPASNSGSRMHPHPALDYTEDTKAAVDESSHRAAKLPPVIHRSSPSHKQESTSSWCKRCIHLHCCDSFYLYLYLYLFFFLSLTYALLFDAQ